MDHLRYIDLSLSRIRSFLEKCDNIQNKIPNIIHVAGTNGKGSSIAFLRNILEGSSYSTNVFISPHLVEYRERFRLKGELISDEYINKIKKDLEKIEGYENLSIFELTVIIGFIAFYENPADFCILETGLGGRLDATNIIKEAILNIITMIDYDHQNFLGNTLDKIAYEKAGIIKKCSLVVSDYQDRAVQKVLLRQAKKMGSQLLMGGRDYLIEGSVFSYKEHTIKLDNLGLLGKHQINNAALALVSALNIGVKIDINSIIESLLTTRWDGRLQKIDALYGVSFDYGTDCFLDGAHNTSGARVLANFIRSYIEKDSKISVYIFMGMLQKKDIHGFFNNLAFLAEYNTYIQPLLIDDHVCYSKEEIAFNAAKFNLSTIDYGNIGEGIKVVSSRGGKKLIIICGSLYLLGNILGENKLKG